MVTSESEAENVAVTNLEAQFAAEGRTLTEPEKDSIRSSARVIFASTGAAYTTSQASADFSYNQSTGGGGTTTGSAFNWSLDLSDFYNRAEHMQVKYWADYRD